MSESCDWCRDEVKETITLDMGKKMVFDVCEKCAEHYIEGEFGIIKAKIKKANDDKTTKKLPKLGSKVE